jgi:pantoate--beta-alanine ligase
MEGQFDQVILMVLAQLLKRLFEIVTPKNAYFGEKDFQQLTNC